MSRNVGWAHFSTGRFLCLVGLMMFQSIGGLAQSTNTSPFKGEITLGKDDQTTTNAAPATIEGVTAEAQWRPGLATTYPLLEIYLANQSGKPVEWKRALLNGNEVKGMTNGVVWTQFQHGLSSSIYRLVFKKEGEGARAGYHQRQGLR